jgi:hypothetical protein
MPLLAGIACLLSTAPLLAQAGGMGGGFAGGAGGAGGVAGAGGGLAGGAGGLAGGGFAGGTSGSSGLGFTGNTGSGASALGFTGTSGTNTGTGRFSSGFSGSTSAPGPQQTNLLRSFYSDPYSMGYYAMGSTSSRYSFGQPVYTVATTTGTVGSLSSLAPGGLVSATSYPERRAPAFITTIGFERAPFDSKKVQVEVQDIIDRSSRLRANGAIRVTMQGQVAILQGRVSDARSRRLAESLVRLTPGVRGVQNQLAISP